MTTRVFRGCANTTYRQPSSTSSHAKKQRRVSTPSRCSNNIQASCLRHRHVGRRRSQSSKDLLHRRSRGNWEDVCVQHGIAAEQLDVSRTAHIAFKVIIPIEKSSTCNIGRNSAQAHLIGEAILIIFDEAPMADRKVIECIERTLRDIPGCDDIFGGKVVVFGGDFRQILPVVRHGSRADIVNASLNKYVIKNLTAISMLAVFLS